MQKALLIIVALFCAAWALDYSSADPTGYIACACNFNNNQGGFTIDGGTSWTKFTTQPATLGGSIAVADSNHIIWVPANSVVPKYTSDGGANWSSVPGLPGTGWNPADFFASFLVAADRINIGTFAIDNTGDGVRVSTDNGGTWTSPISGTAFGSATSNARLRATPGFGNDFWLKAGVNSDTQNKLVHITNSSGWSASTISGVLPTDFGFGAPRNIGGYPTMFMIGSVNGVSGIWRSENANAATPNWNKIGNSRPTNWTSSARCINGDANTFGVVYVCLNSSGYAVGVQ